MNLILCFRRKRVWDGLLPEDVEPRNLSPLALAFVGDGVYELMVRERLVCQANRPVNELHKQAVAMVRAEAQAAAIEVMLPLLTEEEAAVFRRGRNAHTARSGGDYHRPPAWKRCSATSICAGKSIGFARCSRRRFVPGNGRIRRFGDRTGPEGTC